MRADHQQRSLGLVRRLLAAGRSMRMSVAGSSMTPVLEEGDFVEIEPVAAAELRRGDLVAFLDGESIVTHVLHFHVRLKGRRWLLLKGVANSRGDWPVDARRALGRVTRVEREGRVIRISPAAAPLTSARAWLYLLCDRRLPMRVFQ